MTLDLPTPPLPEPTQITFLTWASAPSGSEPRPSLLPERRLLVVGQDVEADVDAGDAVELADRLGHAGLEVAADRAAGRRQRDHHVDHAVLVDLDRADHLELDDVAPQLGVDHGTEGVDYLVSGGHGPDCRHRWRWAASPRHPADRHASNLRNDLDNSSRGDRRRACDKWRMSHMVNSSRPPRSLASAELSRSRSDPRGAGDAPVKDRRGATCVTPRRLREERVLHSPARL